MDLFTAFAFDQDIEPPISPEERQYYQDPSYYKDYAPSMSFDAVNGTCKVITFQERKRFLTRQSVAFTLRKSSF